MPEPVRAHQTTYTRSNLRPAFKAADWGYYRKTSVTRAVRILGPFKVKTREGVLTCPDGYLAVDAHGWPYPIAADEFKRIYEAVTPSFCPECSCTGVRGTGQHRECAACGYPLAATDEAADGPAEEGRV